MGNFFRSRVFVVMLTLFIILAGIPTILYSMGQGDFVKDALMSAVTPLMRGASFVGASLRGFGEYFTEFDRLKAENAALAARVGELEDQIYNAALLEDENEWMRAYLGIKRAHTDFTLCDADLTGSDSGSYISSFYFRPGHKLRDCSRHAGDYRRGGGRPRDRGGVYLLPGFHDHQL